jgi:hypothetical protein
MNQLRMLCFMLAALGSLSFAGGRVTGNGGDSVVCGGQRFLLDYALMPKADKAQLLGVAFLESSMLRIHSLLSKHSTFLAEQFLVFKDLRANQTEPWQAYFWEFGELDLVNVPDEALSRVLSKDCDPLTMAQLVVRSESDSGDVRFEVNSLHAEAVLADPLQASLLYVHEWLWDLVGDAAQVRRLNAFLHSSVAADADTAQFLRTLESLGVNQQLATLGQTDSKGTLSIRLWSLAQENRVKAQALRTQTQMTLIVDQAESSLNKLQRIGLIDERAGNNSIEEPYTAWTSGLLGALVNQNSADEAAGFSSSISRRIYLTAADFSRRSSFDDARNLLKSLRSKIKEYSHPTDE